MEPLDRFRLMAALALVDARLAPAEQEVLLRAARGLRVPVEQARAALEELAQGGKLRDLTPPSDPRERSALFRGLLDVVLADGVVSPQELGCLKNLAPSFGVNPGDVPSLLEQVQGMSGVGAAASAVPPPLPTEPPPERPRAKPGEAGCPSCGAPVEFKNARSVAVVCGYCDTTVVREDQGQLLRDLGKISHVVADASPIRLGASGRCFGVEFQVLGRVQVVHAAGTWNEWFLQWASGGVGWLGEALGQYQVTYPDRGEGDAAAKLPAFDELRVGHRVPVDKRRYTITEVNRGRVTGTEGETPFVAPEGYELPYADLRFGEDGFATIDYSEEPPLLFVGRTVRWKQLEMRNFRKFDGWD